MDNKERFSNRADNYAKYRPSYPAQAIDHIIAQTGITPQSAITDLGSGTGKFTRLFLERGFSVLAIEPNEPMRTAAEHELSSFPGFRSIAASAEETTLPDHSVDLITVAQAFHWFDRENCKAEFQRIVKLGGYIVLVWNRREYTPGFMSEYRDIITRLYDNYHQSAQEHMTEDVFADFFNGNFFVENFFWKHPLDSEGLLGRSLSNSHAPLEGHPNYEPLKVALQDLFKRYQNNGTIKFEYKTEVVIGRL